MNSARYSKIQHGNAYGNEATDVGLTIRHRAKEDEYEDNAPKEFECGLHETRVFRDTVQDVNERLRSEPLS
jgi:hypothetical protein